MADSRISPDVLAEAKRLYEQTLAPVYDIALMMGVSKTTFYQIARREGWRGRRSPLELSRPSAPAAQGLTLARKLEDAIGDQIDAIKHVTKLVGAQEQAGEGARAVAAVSRSLRETHALIYPAEAEKKSDDADGESYPYDIEKFRDELARALRAVIAEECCVSEQADAAVRNIEGPRLREAED